MWIRILAAVLALVIVDIVPAPAFAALAKYLHDILTQTKGVTIPGPTPEERLSQATLGVMIGVAVSDLPHLQDGANAAIASPKFGTAALTNVDAGLQPNEPTEGGLMTRTVWGTFKAPDVSRIVIHTFGSEINTVLAVYRGTEISNLVRVTGSAKKPLAGIGSTGTLVQFNTVKDADYAVQIGSRNQAEGDISLNAFRFPPGGGLAAFLAVVGGNTTNPFNGRAIPAIFTAAVRCRASRQRSSSTTAWTRRSP